MSEETTQAPANELIIRGRFENPHGFPISRAAVHERFLGDPPSNCGTFFDLEIAPAHTDSSGLFSLALSRLDERFSRQGPPGVWRRGCFLILAVKDARTIGFTIASGDELLNSPVSLATLPLTDIQGKVVDETGSPIAGARIEVDIYLFFVGRGPCPEAPINFWLSRPGSKTDMPWEKVSDLRAITNADGGFIISRAPAMPGALRLAVTHPDFATLETDYYPYQPKMQLTIQAGAAVHIRLNLPGGEPAVGFKFHLEGVPEGATVCTHRSGVTDNTGHCKIGSLPPGSFTVRYFGGASEPLAVPAIPVPGLRKGERREISLSAVQGSILCGRVLKTKSKAPILHAEVRFESEVYPDTASTFQATYTNADGDYIFPYAVAPGPFRVCVSAWPEGKQIGQYHQINVGSEPRTELTFYLPL